MEKSFEWSNIRMKDDYGVTVRATLCVVANTVEEAREQARRSPRYADKPEAVDKPPREVRKP